MKEHQVKTVQDIINCTNEDNLDNFLKDLRTVIETSHALQKFSDLVADQNDIKKELNKLEGEGFTWIDDGKNNAEIQLKPK